MNQPSHDRRYFLKRLALGSVGAPVLGSVLSIQEAFAEEVNLLRLPVHTAATFRQLREEYLLAPEVVYLNHASIGTVPRPVHEAHKRYLALCETNPWLYIWGGGWEEAREAVRARAARVLQCDATEVAITHNTTEAFNVLAHGLPLGPGDEVVFSSVNHSGASVAFSHMAAARGFEVKRFTFPVQEAAMMTRDDLLTLYDQHITPRTRLLVFPHLDNAVGVLHPVRELAQMARGRGVTFIAVDAAQTVGMLPVDVSSMGVDVFATSPHKWLQAPKGLGLAYISQAMQEVLRPMWTTWGQTRWAGTGRAYEDYGTRDMAEVLTLGDAIDFQLQLNMQERTERLRSLWSFTQTLVQDNAKATWRSPTDWNLSGSLYAVEIDGWKSSELFEMMYQDHGFVFRAFELDGLNTVRLSPNVFTTEEEISRFFEIATR